MSEADIPMPMARIRERLGISASYFTAMKVAMGLKSVHLGTVSQFAEFLKANPNFKFTDVYHKTGCDCKECQVRRQRRAARLNPVGV